MATAKKNYSSAIDKIKEVIVNESQNTQVLCVHGGNERIRRQLVEEVKKEISTKTNSIIDFDIASYEGMVDQLARLSIIIRTMKNQEKMFPSFDYAYIQYMKLRGFDVKRTLKKNRITDHPLYNIAISVSKIWIFKATPISEILETIKAAADIFEQSREYIEQRQYRDARQEIDQLARNPLFLMEKMPQYFAEDLNAYLKNSQSLTLCLNGYVERMLKEEDNWLLGEYGVTHYIQGTKWLIMSGTKWNYTNKDRGVCFTELSLNEIMPNQLTEPEQQFHSLAELQQQMDNYQKEMLYALGCLGRWNEYVIREVLVGERVEDLSVYISLRVTLGYLIKTEGAVCGFDIAKEITLEEYAYEKRLLLLKKMEVILSGKDSEYFTEKEKLLYFRICFHIMEGMGNEQNEPILERLNKPFMSVAKYLLNENDGEELGEFCKQAERTYRNENWGIKYQLLILRYCAQALCETDTVDTEYNIIRMSNTYSLKRGLDYLLDAASAGIEYMYRMNMYREMNLLSEAVSRSLYHRHLYYRLRAVNARARSYIDYDQIAHIYMKCFEEQSENFSMEQIGKFVNMRHAVRNSSPDSIEKEFKHLYEVLRTDRENPLYLELLDAMTNYFMSVTLNVDENRMKAYLKKYMGELKCVSDIDNSAKEIYMVKRASYYESYDKKVQEIHELIEITAKIQNQYKGELYLHYGKISRIIATINYNVTTWNELRERTGGIGDDRNKFESVFLELYEQFKKGTIDFELLSVLRMMAEVNCCYFRYVPQVVMNDIDIQMKTGRKLNSNGILCTFGIFHAGWGNDGLIESKQKSAFNLPSEKKRGGLHLEKYFCKYKRCFNRLYRLLQEKYEEEMQKYIQERLPEELAERYKQFLIMVFSGAYAGDEAKAYEILSMLDIDCQAEKRAARRKTDTTAIECPKAEMFNRIMNYSFTKKENRGVKTKEFILGVIKGWKRLREEYGAAYVKDILDCVENYENDKWHEPFGVLPKKLKNEILVQKGRK